MNNELWMGDIVKSVLCIIHWVVPKVGDPKPLVPPVIKMLTLENFSIDALG